MLKTTLISLLSILILSGCGQPKISTIKAPDGSTYKKVKCNKDSNICLEKASSSCDNKTYQVISSHSRAGGLFVDFGVPGPSTWYSLTYKCGPSDGKMPDFKFTGQQYIPPTKINVNSSSRPKTTNCYKVGNSINCTSY